MDIRTIPGASPKICLGYDGQAEVNGSAIYMPAKQLHGGGPAATKLQPIPEQHI